MRRVSKDVCCVQKQRQLQQLSAIHRSNSAPVRSRPVRKHGLQAAPEVRYYGYLPIFTVSLPSRSGNVVRSPPSSYRIRWPGPPL
jgi:hypothetical protein